MLEVVLENTTFTLLLSAAFIVGIIAGAVVTILYVKSKRGM